MRNNMTEWVSVSDRLPEEDNVVCNVIVGTKGKSESMCLLSAVYDNGKFMLGDVDVTSYVLFWLIIPGVYFIDDVLTFDDFLKNCQ